MLKALSIYNQGYSLQQTSSMLEQIYGERVPRNTVHYWTKRYRSTFTYLDIREKDEKRTNIIHREINNNVFRLHLKKLERMKNEHETLSRFLLRTARGIDRPKDGSRPLWDMIGDENDHLLDDKIIGLLNAAQKIVPTLPKDVGNQVINALKSKVDSYVGPHGDEIEPGSSLFRMLEAQEPLRSGVRLISVGGTSPRFLRFR